jgi:putative transposase
LSNHFHLLLQLAGPGRLSRLVAGLLLAYWHHYRRRYGLVGHLFQGRFKSPAAQADRYALSCGRYIERNPVEARVEKEPWRCRWSSCGHYALGESDPLLAVNPWYEPLALELSRRQALWRGFVMEEGPNEAAVRREDWVIRDREFRQQMQQPGARPGPRRRGRPVQRGTARRPGKSDLFSKFNDTGN